MLVVLLIILAIPTVLVAIGIVAFVFLPVKLGIAAAVLAFLAAVAVFSWLSSSVDLSH